MARELLQDVELLLKLGQTFLVRLLALTCVLDVVIIVLSVLDRLQVIVVGGSKLAFEGCVAEFLLVVLTLIDGVVDG